MFFRRIFFVGFFGGVFLFCFWGEEAVFFDVLVCDLEFGVLWVEEVLKATKAKMSKGC